MKFYVKAQIVDLSDFHRIDWRYNISTAKIKSLKTQNRASGFQAYFSEIAKTLENQGFRNSDRKNDDFSEFYKTVDKYIDWSKKLKEPECKLSDQTYKRSKECG